MFDFSMGEIGLIGVIALVVLGPDKLPAVAKTAGTLMGKAQRLVSQVKSDIDKEVELSELKKIQEDARKMAANIEQEMKTATDSFQKNVDSVKDSAKKLDANLKAETKKVSDQVDSVREELEKTASSKPVEASADATGAEDSFGWGEETPEIDTSSLDSAFNWGKKDSDDVIPAPVEVPAAHAQTAPQAATQTEQKSPSIEDLMREIALLRSEIGKGQSSGSQNPHQNAFARGSRTNRTRITR